MRVHRTLALATLLSLVAGIVVFISAAGAAAPTVTLSPSSGPSGTAITVKLSTPCKMPPAGLFSGGITTYLSPAGPSAGGYTSAYVYETSGQSVGQIILTVPAQAPAGHYVVRTSCFVYTAAGTSTVSYAPAVFVVTGGPALPAVTLSRASGPVGTVVDVSGACAPSAGQPSAQLGAAMFSAANPNLSVLGFAQGVGPVLHVRLPVPPPFQPGKYWIAASCGDYVHTKTFAEKAFTVLPGPPSAPGSVVARPAPTASKTVGPIVVTYGTAYNHGYAISKYTARCTSSNGGVTRAGVHVGPTAAPITVANATLKKTYRCVVVATNAKGNGPASRASDPIVVGAPAQVGRTTATTIAPGKVRVSFPNLTAAQTNGAPLTTPKYTARCESSSGTVTRTATGVGTPIVVTVPAGLLYLCTVYAHNSRGAGRPSVGAVVVA